MNRKQTAVTALIVLLMAAACAVVYFSPHWAVRNLREAADSKDAARLAQYIDFPALKANVKATLTERIEQSAASSSAGRFGAVLASAFLSPMIDNLLTPDTLGLIMRGTVPKLIRKKSEGGAEPTSEPAADSSAPQASKPTNKVQMAYEGRDRFVVTVKNTPATEQTIALVLARDGVVGWKLVALRF